MGLVPVSYLVNGTGSIADREDDLGDVQVYKKTGGITPCMIV